MKVWREDGLDGRWNRRGKAREGFFAGDEDEWRGALEEDEKIMLSLV